MDALSPERLNATAPTGSFRRQRSQWSDHDAARAKAAPGRVEAVPSAIWLPESGHWARAVKTSASHTGRRPRPAAHGRLHALTQAVCRRRRENGLDWSLPEKGLKDSHSDRTDGLS